MAAGANPIILQRGVKRAVDKAVEGLRKQSVDVDSKESWSSRLEKIDSYFNPNLKMDKLDGKFLIKVNE